MKTLYVFLEKWKSEKKFLSIYYIINPAEERTSLCILPHTLFQVLST